MSTTIAPAIAVPLFDSFINRWLGFNGNAPAPKVESIYKQRITCLNNLASIQDDLWRADEEYATVISIEGAHNNALDRMEAATTSYRIAWAKCEGIIVPK